jgi:chromosome partitioning protein
MRKIAIHIQKGGVGKTTISGNLGFALSQNHKTILFDCDPQGNLSSWLLTDPPQYELADVLTESANPKDVIVPITDNLHIMPTFGLGGGLKDYSETKLINEQLVFKFLAREVSTYGYDYAIYDLSPGMRMLERCVIMAVDEVITPLTAELFSVDGVESFSDELRKINKNWEINVGHNKIIINALNQSFRRHKSFMKHFESLDYKMFTIPQDSKLAESQVVKQSIFDYAPDSRAIPQFIEIAQYIREEHHA